jgi:hypothetical protein
MNTFALMAMKILVHKFVQVLGQHLRHPRNNDLLSKLRRGRVNRYICLVYY